MPSATLARLVLLEARRGGLPWLALAAVAASVVLALFLSQVALTESRTLQAAVVAALLRLCAVFLLTVHVAGSVLREINDKGLEHMLSLPLSRTSHYLGRLGGFVIVGAALSACFALPLLLWSSVSAVLLWGVSLALELALVAAAALFFSLSLAQPVPAIAATAGFYLLARTLGAIQAIGTGPLAELSSAQWLAQRGFDALALLFPRLDAATRTEWLLYALPAPGDYARALAGLAVYAALLVAAGLFDFHRRSA